MAVQLGNSPSSPLSERGALAAATPLRIDYDAYHEAVADRYHPTENPDGKLPLNIAENRLSWHELKARIETITSEHEIPEWVAGYASARGALTFRDAAARFLSEHLTGCPIDPDHLGVSAGATGVIEMTSFILGEVGDVAVIPAPCYPVYRQDIAAQASLQRFDLVTHHELAEIANGPTLSLDHLEQAKREIEASGRRFRMLILTTPDNPTGGVYSRARLTEIADWCIAREIHLVVNEIYGLSLIDPAYPSISGDYAEVEPFRSFANVMAEKQSDRLHLWYALSKDLGISGFRVGIVYSRNAPFIRAYQNLNLTHSVSNHTQWLLSHLLTDTEFMTGYIARNQRRLTESYALVATYLKRLGIPYVPSRGSLFAWIDLSEFMEGDTEEAELALWQSLFEEAGAVFTPGPGFGHSKRGLFRVVYPCVTIEELEVVMRRVETFVEARRV